MSRSAAFRPFCASSCSRARTYSGSRTVLYIDSDVGVSAAATISMRAPAARASSVASSSARMRLGRVVEADPDHGQPPRPEALRGHRDRARGGAERVVGDVADQQRAHPPVLRRADHDEPRVLALGEPVQAVRHGHVLHDHGPSLDSGRRQLAREDAPRLVHHRRPVGRVGRAARLGAVGERAGGDELAARSLGEQGGERERVASPGRPSTPTTMVPNMGLSFGWLDGWRISALRLPGRAGRRPRRAARPSRAGSRGPGRRRGGRPSS